MSKKILIKDIQDIKNFNIICTNAEETKECFSILEKLELDIYENNEHNNTNIICRIGRFSDNFCSTNEPTKYNKNISFYDFKKECKKFFAPQYNTKYGEKAMIKYIKNNKIAIHCPTEEDYNTFINILKINKEKLYGGVEFEGLDYYKMNGKNTCVYYLCDIYDNSFMFKNMLCVKNHKILTVQELFDKFKIEKKEEIKDIEYDLRTGRVIKINNYKSHKYIFIVSDGFFLDANPIENYSRDYLDFIVYMGLAYISKETCDKAKQEMIKKVEEENKKIGAKC